MDYEEKEKLRMDFILDLRNGRYNVTFKDVMDMLGDNIDIEELSRQKKENFNYVRYQTIGRNAKLIK